ncbi:hypothetical protein F4774DRAFT_405546 [Daldinia eschscholtzii]|nr:hypothetical protein F4774DRAFT_405546 [Daldinia eschscholtzii]
MPRNTSNPRPEAPGRSADPPDNTRPAKRGRYDKEPFSSTTDSKDVGPDQKLKSPLSIKPRNQLEATGMHQKGVGDDCQLPTALEDSGVGYSNINQQEMGQRLAGRSLTGDYMQFENRESGATNTGQSSDQLVARESFVHDSGANPSTADPEGSQGAAALSSTNQHENTSGSDQPFLSLQPNLNKPFETGQAAIAKRFYQTLYNPEKPTAAEAAMANEMVRLFPHLFCDDRTKLRPNGPDRYSRVIEFNGQQIGIANFFQEEMPKVDGYDVTMTIDYIMSGIHARTSLVPYFWFRRIRVRFDLHDIGDMVINQMPNPMPYTANYEQPPTDVFRIHEPLRSSGNPPVDIPNAPNSLRHGPGEPLSIASVMSAPPARAAAANAPPPNMPPTSVFHVHASPAYAPTANAPIANAPAANAPAGVMTSLPGHLFQRDGLTKLVSCRQSRKILYAFVQYKDINVGDFQAVESKAVRNTRHPLRYQQLWRNDGRTEVVFNPNNSWLEVHYDGKLFGHIRINHPTRGLDEDPSSEPQDF